MSWDDLHGEHCYTITPGLVYNPDGPEVWQITNDRCHPYAAIPARVLSLYPDWAKCSASWGGGFYDPPKTLRMGTALLPTAPSPTFVPTAQPVPKSPHLIAPVTSRVATFAPDGPTPTSPDTYVSNTFADGDWL
ncbi:uncharacterized protein K460DRAFT_413671 [Cucurbitaria berberidis CBS 394.84]|uniref:Uncharacterized protein n=1 Tax=Cucurbitaria berberidis CBS 394.84 TaxID=1168544 RepID=A0A9P4LDR7_9PLEO|nr:uncharacterized protein K460DRAFT_413671 [Cucurbitaria berberidis CBS 394.84]KAF1852216.1 hypothetical protein K460DRAFT_413671 [Cucurbitaria berberidis CBS 394.84]